MHSSDRLLRYGALSLGLHIIAVAALFHLDRSASAPPLPTPVRIVNLPPGEARRLPPVRRPAPRETPAPRGPAPVPKKFGTAEELRVPRTAPARPAGKGEWKGGGTAVPGTGPLPFLSQADIDQLARRGMPPRRPGDDSVTLDTDEFKFISYNRWLKIKVESVLRYPEIAAVSGYQGVLYIKFDILKDGSLGGVELLKSSGYKILDDEALRSIRDSAPFAPLPEEWGMQRYSIRAAVIFYLSSAYLR